MLMVLGLVEGKSQSREIGGGYESKLEYCKNIKRILFVDDDTRFKVVKILKRSGWGGTC